MQTDGVSGYTMRVGAHVSISGGFSKAVNREVDLGGNCGQIFVGSPRGWAVNEVDADEAASFIDASRAADVGPWIVHGTYLINFATPKDDLGERSVETVQAELDAASALDIPYYTFHPGSHTGAGVEQGIENIGERLSELSIPDNVTLLLENTAGSGTSLGKTFDQLDAMIAGSSYGYTDIGVCLDSCHLFAGGYDFRTESGLSDMVDSLDQAVGVDNVHFLHLNDSKHPFDSEKDEHEHIGEGEIGSEGFRLLINDTDFRELPMALETPEDEKGYEWNINRIRELRD